MRRRGPRSRQRQPGNTRGYTITLQSLSGYEWAHHNVSELDERPGLTLKSKQGQTTLYAPRPIVADLAPEPL